MNRLSLPVPSRVARFQTSMQRALISIAAITAIVVAAPYLDNLCTDVVNSLKTT